MHQLNPVLNKNKWDSEDCRKLFALHRKFKNRWKNIAENFEGRTDNSIKNQFFSVVRKALRKACKVLGNVSNTGTINKIKPKVLSNYLSMEYEVSLSGKEQSHVKISLNDFVQKFAFTKYNELAKNLTDDDLVIIEKCLEFLNKLNDGYVKKKMTRIRYDKINESENPLNTSNKNISGCKGDCSTNQEFSSQLRRNTFDTYKEEVDSRFFYKNEEEINRGFQGVLLELDKFKETKGRSNEELVSFFRQLGNYCYGIVNTLENTDKNQCNHYILENLANISKNAHFLIEADLKTNIEDHDPTKDPNPLINICSGNSTPKVSEKCENSFKNEKLNDNPLQPLIKTPDLTSITQTINPLETPKIPSDSIKKPELSINSHGFTSILNSKPELYTKNPLFSNIISQSNAKEDSGHELKKRALSVFRVNKETDRGSYFDIDNYSALSVSSRLLIKKRHESFGQVHKQM